MAGTCAQRLELPVPRSVGEIYLAGDVDTDFVADQACQGLVVLESVTHQAAADYLRYWDGRGRTHSALMGSQGHLGNLKAPCTMCGVPRLLRPSDLVAKEVGGHSRGCSKQAWRELLMMYAKLVVMPWVLSITGAASVVLLALSEMAAV